MPNFILCTLTIRRRLTNQLVLGITDYGISFCSVLATNNLVAMQFHPEKSGRPGLQILRNFCRWRGNA